MEALWLTIPKKPHFSMTTLANSHSYRSATTKARQRIIECPFPISITLSSLLGNWEVLGMLNSLDPKKSCGHGCRSVSLVKDTLHQYFRLVKDPSPILSTDMNMTSSTPDNMDVILIRMRSIKLRWKSTSYYVQIRKILLPISRRMKMPRIGWRV